MREIKFRAWGKKERLYLPIIEINAFNWYVRTYDNKYPAQEIELEQFTGLYDKNGNEIYEGDIVKLHVVILSPDDKVGFIEYRPEFGYCINFGGKVARQEYWAANDKHTIEVIGNIHENKELLDGGNNQD
ncbi:YopX family protein [Fructobacillus fructosus]|uniref:YopX family protein n=1 Tax=Fructobacillus fructosus TaxID=1631 RepID=UPI00200A9AD2|nr:YopX family protein [Fructobacillus fructosus]MCK8639057.1 YopX family protein [Fructobacillus fructosus]